MTEQEWLTSADPLKMLEFLRGSVTDRKLRLFAVACCRRIWHLIADVRSRRAVEVSEAFADGRAGVTELKNAQLAAYQAIGSGDDGAGSAATCAELYDATTAPEIWQYEEFYEAFHGAVDAAHNVACARAGRNSFGDPANEGESIPQSNLLRDIFGLLLFRPVTVSSSWLNPTVTQLAEATYAERAFERLPILADALEDAGCEIQDILDHLRQPGEHCKGCWALDLVLGKE